MFYYKIIQNSCITIPTKKLDIIIKFSDDVFIISSIFCDGKIFQKVFFT